MEDIIDPKNSAEKTREVMLNRERQAQKEAQAVVAIQSAIRGFQSFRLFQQSIPLHEQIVSLTAKLEVANNKLMDQEKTHGSHKDRLVKLEEIVKLDHELEIVPGRKKEGPLPAEYARNPSLYLAWVRSTLMKAELKLTTKEAKEAIQEVKHEIDLLEKSITELKVVIKDGSQELSRLQEQEAQLLERMEAINKQFQIS